MAPSVTLCDRINSLSAGCVNHVDLLFFDPAPDSAGAHTNVRGVFLDGEELVAHTASFPLPLAPCFHASVPLPSVNQGEAESAREVILSLF
jgi:hypothetical protein